MFYYRTVTLPSRTYGYTVEPCVRAAETVSLTKPVTRPSLGVDLRKKVDLTKQGPRVDYVKFTDARLVCKGMSLWPRVDYVKYDKVGQRIEAARQAFDRSTDGWGHFLLYDRLRDVVQQAPTRFLCMKALLLLTRLELDNVADILDIPMSACRMTLIARVLDSRWPLGC